MFLPSVDCNTRILSLISVVFQIQTSMLQEEKEKLRQNLMKVSELTDNEVMLDRLLTKDNTS